MKRFYVLAVIAAVFTICEVKGILKECPIISDNGDTIHIPHETNPHKFYKCFMGKKFEFTCRKNKDPPFMLCYNPELQVCDWPWNVTACGGGPSPTPEPTTKPTTEPTTEPTTKPTTEPTTEPTTKPTTEPTTEPTTKPTTKPTTEPTTKPTTEPTTEHTPDPGYCPLNGKHPHRNCKMYYEDHIPMCCLENLVFNPLFCVCDLPKNVPSCKPTSADYQECWK